MSLDCVATLHSSHLSSRHTILGKVLAFLSILVFCGIKFNSLTFSYFYDAVIFINKSGCLYYLRTCGFQAKGSKAYLEILIIGFVKHVGCDLGSLTLQCLRKLPTDDVLNYFVEYMLEYSFPAGTPLPLLLPIMPWFDICSLCLLPIFIILS